MKRLQGLMLSMSAIMCVEVMAGVPYDKMSALVREAATADNSATTRATGTGRTINAFVCVASDNADSLLRANDCKIYDRQGDIFIVSIPTRRLKTLASANTVKRIEASAPCQLTMDTTSTIVNALPVYEGKALPQAFTGKGVVLGIMDVGFDLTNPNFMDTAMEECRIHAFWDQLSKDTIGSTFPVGRDYTTTEEITEKEHSTDGLIQTHGTHTLGIAAGSGYTSPYRGIAYESDICAVSNAVTSSTPVIDSTDLYKYTSAVDALGFKYIFDYATSVGSPCVASFSEGYTIGYDTEDSLYCEYLNKLVGPGRIIVASAGNQSIGNGYMRKTSDMESAGAFLTSSDKSANIYVESDGIFSLNFLSYHNSKIDTLTIHSNNCNEDSVSIYTLKTSSEEKFLEIKVNRYPSTFIAGDTIYCLYITSKEQIGNVPLAVVLEGKQTEVSLRCSGSLHLNNGLADEKWNDAETSHNILAPGCFDCIVTVGATIHRTGFTNYTGKHIDVTQVGRNDGVRAYYSSIGPTVNGTIKPDVMAPGTNVISSYSSFYREQNPTSNDANSDVERFEYDGRTYAWTSDTGTSMATPVVAGAIALWLQAKPSLTPDDVKDIISHTARHPENDMEYPNNSYGYGEIDVYRGLLYVLGLDGIEDLSAEPLQNVKISASHDGKLSITFDDPPQRPFTVSVYSLAGTKVFSYMINATGQSTYTMYASPLGKGIFAVQISSYEKAYTGSTLVRTE